MLPSTTTTIITEARRAFLREIGRRGGLTRAQAFTPDFQRAARAHVRHESNVANGRKGGIAYVLKYGKRRLAENSRAYRLAHPSDLERIVAAALLAIGAFDCEREAFIFPRSRVHHITGDFVFRRDRRIVYADGKPWHTDNTTLAGCTERGTKDAHYDAYLQHRGWRVLRLSEVEIKTHDRGADGGALLAKLRAFVFAQ